MRKKAQLILKRKIRGDSIIQLKDGKILTYYFREYYDIYIYHEKTFENILELDLYKPIYEYEKEKEKNENKLKDKKEDNIVNKNDYFRYKYGGRSKNKISIKELYNGTILIGINNYLIELNLIKKNYNYKTVKYLDNIILDVNELSDKRIIVFTNEKIIILKREKEEYIIKECYPIKENWKTIIIGAIYKHYGDFCQYFSSVELPGNRLLLNSFLIVKEYHDTGCVRGPPTEFCNSKIIFIDMNNFEEIKSTKTFKVDIKYIILENYIAIQSDKRTFLYDINSLNLIKEIRHFSEYDIFCQFENKYIIRNSSYGENYTLTFYKIKNNNLIEHFKVESFLFNYLFFDSYSGIKRFEKNLFILRDKRIIIFILDEIFILKFPIDEIELK